MTTVPYEEDPAAARRSPVKGQRLQLRHGEGDKHRLTSLQGLAALSLDALSSVAYGPEEVALVLAAAGTAAIAAALPVVIVIAGLLLVLVLSYRQVIAAHPEGGGSYGVAKKELGRWPSLIAAAALIVDYVLTVAVSLAAAAASLASAFPFLRPYPVETCLVGVILLTIVNLFGISDSARVLMLPTALFIVSILGVVVLGLARSAPAAVVGAPEHIPVTESLGVLLVLRAFSSGCSSLTGVEAIANGVPMFRRPRVQRAQRTELMLGVLLGVMLIGLAVLIRRDSVMPREGVTILAQLTAGAYGTGWAYYATNIVVALGLGLAANTSFGGLPVLLSLLARDRRLPSLFALRTERPVYRYGVMAVGLSAALLLIAVGGDTHRLIPMFAVGVFIGFTISQVGMVRHWTRLRPAHWSGNALLNGTGAVLTSIAAVVLLVSKFTEGAWVVAIVIPVLILLFVRIERYYTQVRFEIGVGRTPPRPTRPPAVTDPGTKIIIPIGSITALTERTVSAAMALGGDIVLVSVAATEAEQDALHEAWTRWNPGIHLEIIYNPSRTLVRPRHHYIQSVHSAGYWTIVLLPIVEPRKFRYRILHNQRGLLLAAALRERSDVLVCLLPFHLGP